MTVTAVIAARNAANERTNRYHALQPASTLKDPEASRRTNRTSNRLPSSVSLVVSDTGPAMAISARVMSGTLNRNNAGRSLPICVQFTDVLLRLEGATWRREHTDEGSVV
jgi:hypothetical protein